MRQMVGALVLISLGATAPHAADQTILGKQFLLKDPKPGIDATKRKLVAQGKEKASANQIVGDPTVAGATLTAIVAGATSANQVFLLPQGTDPSSGKPFWSGSGNSFKYKDGKGANGAVKTVRIKRAANGTFQIKAVALAKNGAIALAPPNPGTSACVRLDLANGDRYSVVLPPAPDSTVKKDDARTFLSKDALSEGTVCEIPAVCGNGILEPGEQCDGGPACSPTCTQNVPNCCQGVAACADAPGFSLLSALSGFCATALPGSTPSPGAICQPDGSCIVEPLGPIPVCCQGAGTCTGGGAASTLELWTFHNACQGGGAGTTVPNAVCDPGGSCVPQ